MVPNTEATRRSPAAPKPETARAEWLDPAIGLTLISPADADEAIRIADVVGLGDVDAPSLEAVESRRHLLWLLTLVALGVVAVAVLLLPLLPGGDSVSAGVLRGLVFFLAAGFVLYAIDREVHLRRLGALLVDERVLIASLSNRVRELGSMLHAGRAINSALDLDDVLHLILQAAVDLLDGAAGTIMLADGMRLRVVSAIGGDESLGREVNMGEAIAGRVAETREPLLIVGHVDPGRLRGGVSRRQPVESSLTVPLIHRDTLLGVLNVNAAEARPFTEYDLRAVSLFGEQAAAAIANARLYEGQRAQTESLAYRASHDPLTDLANRAEFFERLDIALKARRAAAAAGGVHEELALLFVDLDDFKRVNDTFGHHTGDELLVAIASRVRDTVRSSDVAGRLGGDEFAVLLHGVGDAEAASAFGSRLIDAIAEPTRIGDQRISVGATVGVAVSGDRIRSAKDLVRRADAALYSAKGEGRRLVRAYEPGVGNTDPDLLALEADLPLALERGELEVHYQPVVDLTTGAIVDVEALMRWRHPQRGLLPAGQFVDLAESLGLITDICCWVIGESCGQLATWRAAGLVPDTLGVTVNMGERSFYRSDLIQIVQGILSSAGLPPERLTLELNETVLTRHEDAAAAQLLGLTTLGVRTGLDDFGTGWSRLTHLHQLALSVIKVDRSVVAHIIDDPVQASLVQNLVDLAGHLGVILIAEGVERSEEVAALRRVGCTLAQGAFLGPVLPATEMESRISPV